MANIILFHHALGLTPGVESFAETLREAGHRVSTPDLYDGALFETVADGVAHAEMLGFGEIIARGERAAGDPGDADVYAGFSLGVLPAQKLAQARPAARGALLFHAAIPLGHFGDVWPADVRLQIHVMEDDALGDVAEAKELAASVPSAELFLYPGDGHLFTDVTTPDYDPEATRLAVERTLVFLERIS